MTIKSFAKGLTLLTALILVGCGGGGGGDSGDNFTPLDTTVDYDIAAALFGVSGVSRTFTGSGADSDGNQWTVTRVMTTLATPDLINCLLGETQQDDALTLTVAGSVTTSAGPSCYTTSGLLQRTFSLDVTDSPKEYEILTTGGTLPLIAKIGAGGLSGVWDRFEDTNGDDFYGGGAGDTFIGSSTSNWNLEDQQGKAALVISSVLRDEFGTQEGSETDTYFITPSGTVTGFKIIVTLPGFSLTLTGTVN
jgi:hypothetical protein